MNDLKLWKDLATRSADDPELGQQILEFEADRADGKKKADRWVYVGDFIRVLPSQSATVQASILRMLSGMLGQPAIEAVVGRINNGSPVELVVEATDTLTKNGQRFQWQLVHAFFSKHKAVRDLAPALIDSPITAFLGLHLLVDEELKPQLMNQLMGLKLPFQSINTIFRFWQKKVVSSQEAQWLLFGINESSTVIAIEKDILQLGETEELLDQIFSGQLSSINDQSPVKPKLAHWLLDIHCDPQLQTPIPSQGVEVGAVWIESMFQLAQDRKRNVPTLVLAILRWLSKQADMPQQIVNLVTFLDLRSASLEWIPKEKRREALIFLYSQPVYKNVALASEALRMLDQSPLTRRDSGQLDLAVIGSILRYAASPTAIFKERFSKEQVVAAFLESPDESIIFFETPLSTTYIREVLEVLWRQGNGKKNKIRTCALLVLNLPGTRMEILDDLEPKQWKDLLLETLRIIDESPSPFPAKRISLLARQFCHRIKANFEASIDALLALETPHKNQLCVEVFTELARQISAEKIVSYTEGLAKPELKNLLSVVDHAPGMPYGLEQLLVALLKNSEHPFASQWAATRSETSPNKVASPKVADPGAATRLSKPQVDAIATCDEASLTAKIQPALKSPSIGTAAALERRSPPTKPNVQVVCALAGCHGDVLDVDRQANLYCDVGPSGSEKTISTVVQHWQNNSSLPLIGNAFVHKWEYHLFLIDATIDQLSELAELASQLTTPVFAKVLWQAAARLTEVQAARNKERYYQLISPAFFESCVMELREANGKIAAAILVRAFLTREADVEHLRNEVIELIPALPKSVRKVLQRWVSVEGLTSAKRIERGRAAAKVDDELKGSIAASSNVGKLKRWCADPNWKVADAAASRLLELESAGVKALSEVLSAESLLPRFDIVAETIPFFPSSPEADEAMNGLRELAIANSSSPYQRFIIASQLLQTDRFRSDEELTMSLVDVVGQGGEFQWFVAYDWNTAVSAVSETFDEFDFAIQVATSNQSQAYLKAVHLLIDKAKTSDQHLAAVEAFLYCGSERAYDTRLNAARWLCNEGSKIGLPIVAAHIAKDSGVFQLASFAEAQRIAVSAVATGCRATELSLLPAIQKSQIPKDQQRDLIQWLVANAGSVATIDAAVPSLDDESVESKLTRVARTFKWGMDQALELLGQKFHVSMLTDSDLGYTRLNENRVFVNILPIMEGRQNGQQVVEGLILHELGHHIYHKGRSNEKIWKRAEKAGLHGLLNVVSDEHLERNLRTQDRSYDSRLKQLASFAFQHSQKDFAISYLLELLHVRAVDVLSQVQLRVTGVPEEVRVDSGKLLGQLESVGSSFSRFFRALRMGLGNRYNDPKVEEALKLFNRSFRKSNMRQLYEIALKLKEIFEDDAGFMNFISQDQLVCPSRLDGARGANGLTDEQIQNEIQRITSREELERSKASRGATGGRAINVIDEVDFTPINQVVKAPLNREAAHELARTVAAPAKMLRNYLTDLGQMYVQQRRRLNGYRLDRQAINRLVTRQDPRMMISRQREFKNDLFIGVAIDCSGSMAYNDNINLAKRFAALLAESTRDVEGIDLSLIGFTDDTIFDVGGNQQNAIHTLQAGGGNNDAAALWHMAQEALRSKRKSRLLVMISDGLPTECSVESLRTLVRNLTQKFGICCAQLALEELEEICFPDYVLVKSSSEAAAIRKFGATIAKLIRKTTSN